MDVASVNVKGVNSKGENSIGESIANVFLKSTNNLEWLSDDNVVLLKPALNSSDPYPATTHPLAVKVISKILKDRGAKVVVGDQSGLKHVLQDQSGVIHGNTHHNYIKSGMGTADDKFVSFESEGWDEGFKHHKSDHTPSWPDGYYVSKWIQKADHIINLPRLSAHSQAGATLGFKNMVGILRDDSRMDFHANGPYNLFIKNEARGSVLKSVDDKSNTFIEKIVEINDSIMEKLRLTLFVSTKAQTTFGPNRSALKLWKLELAKSHVVDLNPGLIFASADPVAAESFAITLLKDLRKNIPKLAVFYQSLLLFSNSNISQLDKLPVKDQLYIRHAVNLGLGKLPDRIEYEDVPETLQNRLNNYFS